MAPRSPRTVRRTSNPLDLTSLTRSPRGEIRPTGIVPSPRLNEGYGEARRPRLKHFRALSFNNKPSDEAAYNSIYRPLQASIMAGVELMSPRGMRDSVNAKRRKSIHSGQGTLTNETPYSERQRPSCNVIEYICQSNPYEGQAPFFPQKRLIHTSSQTTGDGTIPQGDPLACPENLESLGFIVTSDRYSKVSAEVDKLAQRLENQIISPCRRISDRMVDLDDLEVDFDCSMNTSAAAVCVLGKRSQAPDAIRMITGPQMATFARVSNPVIVMSPRKSGLLSFVAQPPEGLLTLEKIQGRTERDTFKYENSPFQDNLANFLSERAPKSAFAFVQTRMIR
eukprot:CAMPEP_0184666726 /NCGR_PEP_ID=MMETSP0308-20130426/63325_1 /TAXON_ID=38269 /ORGANISM="Gloeochaete witrockiana, Strain SAG 46.84" /LENGTH=337 /DNA_ID=CAMNT_0027111457 /DNA_START=229 /DNA_END=1242 /DNA_ORIENTATION=-